MERGGPMFKSVLLQKTVVWTWASFLIEKYISQWNTGYFKKDISVLKQCWHCSKSITKNENSHLEVLDYHLRVTLVLQFLLQWIFYYYIKWISKRMDRQMIPNSHCILALKVRQRWAQTPLVIAEVYLRTLTSSGWSITSFRVVNLASSTILFSIQRYLINLIRRLLWPKLRFFLNINCDIKIHRDPVQNPSQIFFWKLFAYTVHVIFQRVSSLQSQNKFYLLICIIHIACLGFFL